MFFPWHETAQLAVESQTVIGLRTLRLMAGGWGAHDEAQLMVREKLASAIETAAMLMAGRSAGDVVARFREHVAANAARLVDRESATGLGFAPAGADLGARARRPAREAGSRRGSEGRARLVVT